MKFIKYLVLGTFFGILLSKAEVISWYRIYEMFRFENFHMFGIMGSAVVVGIITVQLIKRNQMRSLDGTHIRFNPKNMSVTRYLAGGTIFGLGWAMTGACPGPMFIMLGKGIMTIGIVILGAMLGTFLYGALRSKLPH